MASMAVLSVLQCLASLPGTALSRIPSPVQEEDNQVGFSEEELLSALHRHCHIALMTTSRTCCHLSISSCFSAYPFFTPKLCAQLCAAGSVSGMCHLSVQAVGCAVCECPEVFFFLIIEICTALNT